MKKNSLRRGEPDERLLLCQTYPSHPILAMDDDPELIADAPQGAETGPAAADAEDDYAGYNCRIE